MGVLAVLACALAVVLLVVVAVAVARGVGYYRAALRWRFRPERLSTAHALARPGDVLLFTAHAHGFSNSILTRCVFSHAGVVVDVGGVPHVSESTPGFELREGVRMPPGPQLVPLVDRVCGYQGSCFLMPLAGLADDAYGAVNEALLRAHARQPDYPSAARMALGVLFNAAANTAHCFQHVAALLDAAGCAEADAPLSRCSYTGAARAVAALPDAALKNGGGYLPPALLVDDVSC